MQALQLVARATKLPTRAKIIPIMGAETSWAHPNPGNHNDSHLIITHYMQNCASVCGVGGAWKREVLRARGAAAAAMFKPAWQLLRRPLTSCRTGPSRRRWSSSCCS